MERKPMIIYLNSFKKPSNKLYYKKVIYNKNKFKYNSYSLDKNKNSYTKKIIKSKLEKPNESTININECQTLKGDKKSLYSISKSFYKDKFNKNVISSLCKLNLIILLQKCVRGFIIRKKMEKYLVNEKKKFLMRTENPNRIQKKFNLNILEAIKRNSKNQKRFIKLVNNIINIKNTVNSKKKITNKNKTLIYISKEIVRKKNYSFDYKKKEEKKSKNNYDVEFNDNYSNINKKTESNFNISNIANINENKLSIESELSSINIFDEQKPKNINTILENEANENNSKIINNNLNSKNELSNIIKKNEYNKNKYSLKSKTNFNNKRNLVIPDLKNKSYYFSSFQTKENSTSDRNYGESNNYFVLESQRTTKEINNENNTNSIKIREKNEDDISLSGDFCVKDEFDSEAIYQNNKNNLDLINTNIKQNCNPMINQNLSNQNKIINEHKISNSSCNLSCKINIPRKHEIRSNNIFESIKEEKLTEFDNDLNSSFYEDEEFVIINYDYSLNDKTKIDNSLKISILENINITGIPISKSRFIETLKKVIYKGIKAYIFNYLKELKNEENEMDKSLTVNDTCSYIQESRIQKNNIIFNYAQIDIKHFNINNINNILKYNNDNMQNNDSFKEVELFRNKKLDSP